MRPGLLRTGRASAARAFGRSGIRLLCALALVAGAHAAEAPPASQIPVEEIAIRAAVHPGFGRLVFDWRLPITFERQESGDLITLNFARPMSADLEPARTRLTEYVIELRQDETGQVVQLRLAAGVRLNMPRFEPDLVVLDFSHITPADEVAIRTGQHEGFTRVVFEWAQPVQFQEVRHGRRVTITFDQVAQIDAVELGRRLRTIVDEASATSGSGSAGLTLSLKPDVEALTRKFGDRQVVLDLLVTGSSGPVRAEGADPAPPGPDPANSSARAAPPRQPPPASAVSMPIPAPPPSPEPAGIAPDVATDSGAKLASPAIDLEVGSREHVLGELVFSWRRPVAAAVFTRAGHLWVAFDVPPGAAAAPLPPPVDPALAGTIAGGEMIQAVDATLVRFPLRRPVALAVLHEGSVWRVLVQEHPTAGQRAPVARVGSRVRLRLEASDGGRLIDTVDPEAGDRIGIWPFRQPGYAQQAWRRLVYLELLPTVQGVVWRTLSDGVQIRRVEGGLEFDAGVGALLAGNPGEDLLGASPMLSSPPDGMPPADPARRAGDPAPGELATFRPGAAQDEDELPVAAEPPERPTDPVVPAPAPSTSEGAGRGPSLGLSAWRLAPDEDLQDRRAALVRRVHGSAPAPRAEAELDLARFFLSQAMAAETLAVLRDTPDEAAGAGSLQVERQALTGAAELLMGRLLAAAAALKDPAWDADAELALWRAALAVAEDDWELAARELERSEDTLDRYPSPLQLRLGLPAALIALKAGDADQAFSLLDRLRAVEAHATDRARVDFVEGLARALAGEIEQADRIWRALENGPDDETRVKAGYIRATTLLDAGRTTSSEALAELRGAQALWRGHPWEAAMLDGLAQVHAAAHDPEGAIRTWRHLLQRHPAIGDYERIKAAMRRSFADAMLPDHGVELAPLRALALYRAHPELVSDDAEGDRIRRHLAHRLARLDLPEPAIELLDHLIEHRLHGAEKAEAGADLAELWLRESRPEAALAALAQSETALELPPARTARRSLLRARALAASGRSSEALDLISARLDPDAQQLRTTILWQRRDWPGLIRTIEQQLDGRREPAVDLSEDEQVLAIQLATAHGRLAQLESVQGMRGRFGTAMRGEAETLFSLATLVAEASLDAGAILAAASRNIETTRRFLGR